MVKRNSSSNADSLDLLLDTLTNSFGAFLLVALIVALLVTDTSQSDAAPTNVQLKVLENLELEIDTFLQKAVNIQKRIDFLYAAIKKLPATISEEEVYFLQGQLAEIISLQETQTKSLNQIMELHAAIVQLADEIVSKKAAVERENKLRDRIDDIVQEQSAKMRKITKEIESAQKTLVQLQQQLNQKIESAQRLRLSLKEQLAKAEAGNQYRKVFFPRVKPTGNTQISLFLKAGSLYQYKIQYLEQSDKGYIQVPPSLLRDSNNSFLPAGTYRLSDGIKVANVRNIVKFLDERLRGANVDLYFVRIYVWKDSFASWNGIRVELAKRKYRYQLVPLNPTEKISFGYSDKRVQ
jgi:hypothetical protein